ncbi:MAG: glycosyltransferase family 4 protein [Aquihabitans sp.]
MTATSLKLRRSLRLRSAGPSGDGTTLAASSRADEKVAALAPQLQPPSGPKVAYLVSRFPRLTETFVVAEATAVRRAGALLELHPIHRERAAMVQPAATALAPHVHYHHLIDRTVLRAQVTALRYRPRDYFGALGSVVKHNWGSRRLLVGGVAAFPLAVTLAQRFEADGIDHVHAHFATHPAAVAYVVHRLSGIPFSFTAHGSDLHRDQHMLAEKVRRAAFVVTISEYNREVIASTCGADLARRVVVVRCGFEAGTFTARAGPRRHRNGLFRVTCVGTLHEVKGQGRLIEAIQLVRAGGHDVEVTFIGDGPDRRLLTDQVRTLGIQDAVRFLGPLTQPEVRQVLAESDALVVPSVPSADGRREGLPVVILEAMAVGVPVVASRLSGIPEAVVDGHTGILVEPGDVHGLAAAIGHLDRDPAMADRLATAARRFVNAEFDSDRSARMLVELFNKASS